MLYVVIGFLWLSICLYLIFGGADFGAGIVEMLSFNRKEKAAVRNIMDSTMGPVWEANHMWLIIFIVIMFVGFPRIYSMMSVYQHIPLVIMLLGIIARGTSYTFRHYDVVKDKWGPVYDKIFVYSSFLTPMFLGIIAGSAVSGSITLHPSDFLEGYIFSWLSPFNISIGLFTTACCAFLAATYAIKDAARHPETQHILIHKAGQMFVFMAGSAILVFIVALKEHLPILSWIYDSRIGTAAVTGSLISIGMYWICLRKKQYQLLRLSAAGTVALFLVAGSAGHYPNLIYLKDGSSLSLLEYHGAPGTLTTLAWALIIGSCFILPFLVCLIAGFEKSKEKAPEG